MSKEQEIIYEPHPVSPQRKAELRAQGFRIIDAIFKPADEQAEEAPAAEVHDEAPARRARKPKAE
jgi:4-hydroxy-3-methylbut-2-enyl diphosphate reductase IspH